MKHRIRIKYCGGCNPNYDRVAWVEHIKAALENHVEFVDGNPDDYDIVLAVQGCETACADLKFLDKHEIRHITSPEEAEKFIKSMADDGG